MPMELQFVHALTRKQLGAVNVELLRLDPDLPVKWSESLPLTVRVHWHGYIRVQMLAVVLANSPSPATASLLGISLRI